eukprot:334361-Amphidinium_carterae.1
MSPRPVEVTGHRETAGYTAHSTAAPSAIPAVDGLYQEAELQCPTSDLQYITSFLVKILPPQLTR